MVLLVGAGVGLALTLLIWLARQLALKGLLPVPLTLHAITSDIRQTTMDFEANGVTHEVNLSYRPSGFTPQVEAEINEADERGQARMIAGLLSRFLSGWDFMTTVQDQETGADLMGENGEPLLIPYPVDEQSLRLLPINFLGAVFQAIIKDMSPGEERAS